MNPPHMFPLRGRRTCDADDGPLRGVQHVSGGRLGALDAVVLGQVPGQRVSGGREVTHGAQLTGALLRRGPDQSLPLGLVLHLLHGLDGHREKKRIKMELVCKTSQNKKSKIFIT